MPASNFAKFHHEDGRVFALPDLIWHRWCVGEYPQAIGRHEIGIQIPEGFHQRFNGRRVTLMGIKAIWHVAGLVVRIPGLAKRFSLTDAGTGALDKLHASIKFDTGLAKYPVHVFADEDDLKEFLNGRPEEFKLTVGRFRMRRIRMLNGLWPPGQKTMERFHRFIEEHPETTEQDLTGKMFMWDFEGPEALWDDIWQGHPGASPQRAQRRDDDAG